MGTENIYTGLDIGTTKVCAVVVRKNNDGSIDVLGVGSAKSEGLRKGVIVNIEQTVQSITEAIKSAERMSGFPIKSVAAGVSGGHINSINSTGIVAIKGDEVTIKDVERVIENAKAINIPVGSEVLHVIPQQFILDNQSEIKDPVGMVGVRLEVEVHIVFGAVTSVANIMKSCEKAGVAVEGVYLEQLASSEAVLSDDEREIGVALIDGGGGTTDMAVFRDGAIVHTAVLQLGGNNFTKDLAVGLGTPEAEAERVKLAYGSVLSDVANQESLYPNDDDEDDPNFVSVASVGGRPPSKVAKHVLASILQPRADEVFEMLIGDLQKNYLLDRLGAGIVITGGLANLSGIDKLVEDMVDLPVRLGYPKSLGGFYEQVQDAKYATGVGLALLQAKKGHSSDLAKITKGGEDKAFKEILSRMRSWFGEFF